jgi:acyl carrier protein
VDKKKQVMKFIVENFLFGDDSQFDEHTSFLQSAIVDSTGIMEVIGFLEENFGVVLEDKELIPDNLDSVNNICRFLDQKLSGQNPPVSV